MGARSDEMIRVEDRESPAGTVLAARALRVEGADYQIVIHGRAAVLLEFRRTEERVGRRARTELMCVAVEVVEGAAGLGVRLAGNQARQQERNRTLHGDLTRGRARRAVPSPGRRGAGPT